MLEKEQTFLFPELPPPVDRSSFSQPSPSTIKRFWDKVHKTDHCWLWIGAISSPDGYGRFSYTLDGVRYAVSAHRFALSLAYQTTAFVADHRCNEPLCVRVDSDHLVVSNQSENIRYAVECHRHNGSTIMSDSRRRVDRSRMIRSAILNGRRVVLRSELEGTPPDTKPLF